jgi:YaiO family outer membrane protein
MDLRAHMNATKTIILIAVSFFAAAAMAQTDLKEGPVTVTKADEPTVPQNKLILDYEHDVLNRGFSNWDQGYISFGHHFSFGSVIARYNRARRFDTNGEQVEFDAYPHLWSGAYAYMNYGHSNSSIYPGNRYGGEIFQSLGAGYEASFGFRQLNFPSGGVTLWTGSVAKYIGNYYIYVRPYYTPSNIGTSSSWTLGMRYYLDDQQYLAASVGQGLSVQQDPSLNVVGLKSQKASVDAYLAVTDDFFIDPSFGYRRDEIRSDVFRDTWSYEMSLEKRF